MTSCFQHNASLTSWRTLMEYFVLSRHGKESLSTFLSPDLDPDPDHLRGGPTHGENISCIKKSDRQTKISK